MVLRFIRFLLRDFMIHIQEHKDGAPWKNDISIKQIMYTQNALGTHRGSHSVKYSHSVKVY